MVDRTEDIQHYNYELTKLKDSGFMRLGSYESGLEYKYRSDVDSKVVQNKCNR